MIIWITGLSGAGKTTLAGALYKSIKKKSPNVLWIDGDALKKIIPTNGKHDRASRIDRYKKMINIVKFFYDQKINVIISTLYFNNFMFKNNKKIFKNYFQIYLKSDIAHLIKRDSRKIYSKNINKKRPFLVGVDIKWDEPKKSNLIISNFFDKEINMIKKKILLKINNKIF